ncbi:unnamed protein product [Acanthoscelides obtectus]|uniref:Uncharacterized protein n=1 Tax=Acanthoscelides obtectus TaxID=200917 RepID=A0A9P0KC88_ACAOB|nr:unnamed protein product [Acanthoscelides obtectus]CAK1645714.1 hypothetical protein AOBTE_LOCUS14223 [Acanthoscelides obtectus]
MAYLQELHPELFFALPRPGGIANIELPEAAIQPNVDLERSSRSSRSTMRSRSSLRSKRSKSVMDATSFMASPGYVSRDYRIRNAMQTAPWVLFSDMDTGDDDQRAAPDPSQDIVDLLAATFSVVMVMANGKGGDIPRNHLRWALSFLENVKDEFGNAPPNVQGIINNIKLIDDKLVSYNEGAETAGDGSGGDVLAGTEPEPEPEPPTEEAPAEEDEAPAEE